MTLEEQIQKLTEERDEEKAIVDRVWAALGISTYEQAKPLAIDEHVKRIVEERDAALKACAEMRNTLLGIIGACLDEPLHPDGGRAAGEFCWRDVERTRHAISTDCGKGYVKADEIKPLHEALEEIEQFSVQQGIYGLVWAKATQALVHAAKLMDEK